MNCWEFMNCKVETHNACPAHPDKGLDCWKVTGTKCSGGMVEKASLEEKVLYCRKCLFFREFAHKF